MFVFGVTQTPGARIPQSRQIGREFIDPIQNPVDGFARIFRVARRAIGVSQRHQIIVPRKMGGLLHIAIGSVEPVDRRAQILHFVAAEQFDLMLDQTFGEFVVFGDPFGGCRFGLDFGLRKRPTLGDWRQKMRAISCPPGESWPSVTPNSARPCGVRRA